MAAAPYENDELFLETMRHPLFESVCRLVYGEKTAVSCFRAMFMNKPAGKGTLLPFHQDRWQALNKDPELTIWMALDPATSSNGCVEVIPASHLCGLINPSHPSGFLSDAQQKEWVDESKKIYLELEAGDVALLHNKLLHGSNKNNSQQSRRAFSVCYMDAATVNIADPAQEYPVIFGKSPFTLL